MVVSDFVTIRGVEVRVGDTVRLVREGTIDDIDGRDAEMPIRFESGEWPKTNHITGIEVLPPPLVIGDRVVLKHGISSSSRTVDALVDVDGVPHLVCDAWGGVHGKVAVPVADYVRARA